METKEIRAIAVKRDNFSKLYSDNLNEINALLLYEKQYGWDFLNPLKEEFNGIDFCFNMAISIYEDIVNKTFPIAEKYNNAKWYNRWFYALRLYFLDKKAKDLTHELYIYECAMIEVSMDILDFKAMIKANEKE